MTVKEAINVLERSCDFHYEETDKCYGCLFENSGWCGKDFHDNLLSLLKEQEATIKAQQFILNNACEKLKEQYRDAKTAEEVNVSIPEKCSNCPHLFGFKCRADKCPYNNNEQT